MSPQRWGACVLSMAMLCVCSVSAVQGAIGPSNVLVLYNQASPDGIAIANYYAQAHPGVQLLGLSGVTTNEEISQSDYLNIIRPQILPALTSTKSVIVTTKGLPLRISNSTANPGIYTDPFNIARTVASGTWKSYSSLESELTRIDTISTAQQMGDNAFTIPRGGSTAFPPPAMNPYYMVNASFNYSTYYNSNSYNGTVYGGMRLTSRLDGYTVADVDASIDRAKQAVLLPNGRQFVLDDDPNVTYDKMAELKTNVLTPASQLVTYNNTTDPILSAAGPVMGYVSHGVHGGGLSSNYITSQLTFQYAPGAVFETHESYNAYSFQTSGSTMGQGQLAQWIAKGGTAGVGNVQEPGAGENYEPNEDQMFKMLLNGYTWAEAAWSSTRQLSYVTTVVGDPLMTWRKIIPGDINMDGSVNAGDLAVLAANWNKTGQSGGFMWAKGDLNCDGLINAGDLAVLAANWGKVASASVASSLEDSEAVAIPEPSILQLLATGIFVVFLGGIFHRKKLRYFVCRGGQRDCRI